MYLQAASMSCLAMFQNVALRAFEINFALEMKIEPGVGVCGGDVCSFARTRRDLAPLRCLAHSDMEVSRNS